MRSAPVTDGRLAYTDAGAGRPLVFLHGGALDHRAWSRQVEDFAPRYGVIAPDFRGHGDASTPDAPFRHCDDIAELLRQLGTGPVTLVGLSMGAGVAVDIAVEHPGLVHALVVTGTGTSDPDWRDPWILDWFTTSARQACDRDAEGWIDTFLQLGSGPHRSLDDVDPQVVAELREQAEKVIATHIGDGEPVLSSPVPDVTRRSREIAVPVLALPGSLDADDHIRLARELAERVANGSWAMIEQTAHYPNMERPAVFNRLVLDFLDATG